MAETDPRDNAPVTNGRRRRGWQVVGVIGELLITIGVVLLLLVVYELWWTNVKAEKQAEVHREQLVTTWQALPEPPKTESPPIPAEAFALMYIPRLQADVWQTPLIEGVDPDDLSKGIGHFPESALPGQIGNAAFAGHRATHGEPLANVDQLFAGDMVYIQTAVGWYTYRLTEDQLVAPTDVWVVDPVPGQPAGTAPTEPMLTLVTCHPRWGSTQRWIWWGELVAETSAENGPPAEIAALLEGS